MSFQSCFPANYFIFISFFYLNTRLNLDHGFFYQTSLNLQKKKNLKKKQLYITGQIIIVKQKLHIQKEGEKKSVFHRPQASYLGKKNI
ncbi:hypothetical protein RFI_31963 [Reticulomyxa filosa]|uniref:Uncharacterized protein n=1 Tax=Reticulomyxa filosa TaxID=46433 RepID=X6LU54_RETFI|nr:hypothetical protein RFI_31963 [Reticulomyxa filosa]|eukprot:ETO05433.1 hypothetical protein RFI_31963 [Reticulomyxa filosa]